MFIVMTGTIIDTWLYLRRGKENKDYGLDRLNGIYI